METDELAEYLNALKRSECYRTEKVLKQSPHETTQLVFFVGANGAEIGPYIRKYIALGAHMGQAYEIIYEAQKLGRRFRHLPHIIECYRTDTHLVVVMEYVHGETLQDMVYRCDPSPRLAANLFPTLCEAVIELHEGFDAPLIHRDLKPSNVILSNAGLTLIDFGIARPYRANASEDTTRFGTRAYAPPEQFGYGQTDVRSDVYALGMILYYLLVEKTPHANLHDTDFADPLIPEALRRVIIKATAFDPRNRYQSARSLLDDFRAALGSVPTVERPAPDVSAAEATAKTISSAKEPPTQKDATSPRRDEASMIADAAETLARNATPADEKGIRSLTARIPQGVGVAWNVIVIITLVLFIGSATNAAFFPTNERDMTYPLWFRLLEYWGFFVVGFSALFYLLLDKRRLRKKIPRIAHLSWRQEVPVCLGFVGILFLIITIVAQFVV